MKRKLSLTGWLGTLATAVISGGCFHHLTTDHGPMHDRPFPLGQVTDAHWETMQTNAEAADFIFFDHEFVGDTAELAPGAKRHLEQVALRLEHTPFPVVIEESTLSDKPELDQLRRRVIVEQLARLGVTDIDKRVVVSSAFAEGFTSVEGERAYYQTLIQQFGRGGGVGRRFGGTGGTYR
jgi:hypothetical protein